MITNTAEELFSSSLNIISLNEITIKETKARFLELQKSGIIKVDCCFDDNIWYTTDEYSNVGFHFKFNVFSYNQYKDIFKMNLEDFITHVKAYLVSIFGRNALSSMQSFLLDLRHIISTNINIVCEVDSGKLRISFPMLCSDFFTLLPTAYENDNIEVLIDAMDSYADINFCSKNKRQRTLADFDTYFTFDDIIKDYWKSSLSMEDRLFYYPLYLWWMITGVLPLRPREFLLTQRDCLNKNYDDIYYLKLRRNKLKGGTKNISYKISDDYVDNTYKIPAYLGDEIQNYKNLTSKYESTDINTLFVTDPHYKKWGQKKHSDSRYLTYVNMTTILKYFYKEIICEKYGLNIVYDYTDRHLSDNEICYIHLGDTRHIALINIMQEGGTPVTSMLLAGHDNIISASHYYSNITSLIECKTYRKYRKLISGNIQYEISAATSLHSVSHSIPLSDGGKCYSQSYQSGEIYDCLATIGKNGEIGYCPSCKYYRKNDSYYFSSDDIYKRHIEDDCIALKSAIELIRQGKGYIEDMGEILLKLRASSISYEEYLMEKHRNSK